MIFIFMADYGVMTTQKPKKASSKPKIFSLINCYEKEQFPGEIVYDYFRTLKSIHRENIFHK